MNLQLGQGQEISIYDIKSIAVEKQRKHLNNTTRL